MVTMELSVPQLEVAEETDETFGRIVAEPLEAGFGTTVGHALRRTLLSALPGTAITAVRIEGVDHEFSTLPNVYFVQEKVDPVVLIEKAPEVSVKTLAETPRPAEKPKKEKIGFLGRVKGFFGSLFHR